MNEWIPCDRELPADGSMCLICTDRGSMHVARAYRPKWLDAKRCYWTVMKTGQKLRAVAWMYLPEPYKPDK